MKRLLKPWAAGSQRTRGKGGRTTKAIYRHGLLSRLEMRFMNIKKLVLGRGSAD